jgi:triacylglycerol lipase
MKRGSRFCKPGIYVLMMLMAVVFTASSALAQDVSCKTKYPIMMAHMAGIGGGTGIVELVMPVPFKGPFGVGGIGGALEACGAQVYYAKLPSLQTNEVKATEFKRQFLEAKAASGARKLNIIGHQQGGLYTRTAITNKGLWSSVASLTTVNTPHHGSAMLTLLSAFAAVGEQIPAVGETLNKIKVFPGDQAYAKVTYDEMSIPHMIAFNLKTPNIPFVYYQSWTSAYREYNLRETISNVWDLLGKMISNGEFATEPLDIAKQSYELMPDIATITNLIFGKNDGLVTENSAKWGKYLGLELGPAYGRGVNHMDVIGLDSILNAEHGGAVWDANAKWVSTVVALKAKGY